MKKAAEDYQPGFDPDATAALEADLPAGKRAAMVRLVRDAKRSRNMVRLLRSQMVRLLKRSN